MDLAALLDRHVLLGLGQATVRMGVRRTALGHVVGLGYVTPVAMAKVDRGRRTGVWS
ncbi:hypothetical protein ACIPJK_34910 [Streptomyces roseus]|uniref:hypothetical protein n=1 Tax=Streptomyces roseus TaxID=66430 RepID=UPI003817333E